MNNILLQSLMVLAIAVKVASGNVVPGPDEIQGKSGSSGESTHTNLMCTLKGQDKPGAVLHGVLELFGTLAKAKTVFICVGDGSNVVFWADLAPTVVTPTNKAFRFAIRRDFLKDSRIEVISDAEFLSLNLKTVTVSPIPPSIHVVKEGEDLITLAIRYGATQDAIKKANNLTNSTLKAGEKITIPLDIE